MSGRDEMDDQAAGTDVDNAADKLRELTISGKYSYYKKHQLSRAVRSRIKCSPSRLRSP